MGSTTLQIADNGVIYIFDELTANLDDYNKKKIINKLIHLSNTKTVIILTHDEVLKNYADNIVILHE